MEHARHFDGIQAGHAANAGNGLQQYLDLAATLPGAARYEATLTICVLQSLLTQCAELLKYSEGRALAELQEPLSAGPSSLELAEFEIVQNTFPEELTCAGLLEHVRDALSHPAPDEEFCYRPTGFTTTNSGTGVIEGYEFTSSPWIKSDRRQIAGMRLPGTEREARRVIERFCTGSRRAAGLEVLEMPDGRFDVGLHGQPYVPLLVVKVSLPALTNTALRLAEALSRAPALNGTKAR